MIIEDLIRLGRPLLEDGLDTREVLRLVSDVESVSTKNFYRHVIVVEIAGGAPPFASHQVWGQEIQQGGKKKAKTDFLPDVDLAINAPFALPQGGNPLHPQGIYGVPVYPCWEKHLISFGESPQKVVEFLNGRLARTLSIELSAALVQQIASGVHEQVKGIKTQKGEKLLGVLVLADTRGPESAFEYSDRLPDQDLGRSHIFPGKFIQPRLKRILDLFWEAKIGEGSGEGERDGRCSVCGREGHLVSAYCKAWPWYLPEWNCPLPEGGNRKLMVEGIALCSQCYKALMYGACLFDKFTRRVHSMVTREIFSPVDNREGKNTTARKKISDIPAIQGTGLLLPLLDVEFSELEVREEFADHIQAMLHPPKKEGPWLERHIDTVTGFDLFLPEGTEASGYRLSLIYFSGDPSRGDIHLRAYIEDVVPSTLRRLNDLGRTCSISVLQLLRAIFPDPSEKQEAYYNRLYRSVPYLLAKAYGGAYIWDQMETVLHRRPLALSRHVRNAVERLRSVTPRYPKSFNEIREEVFFYLAFIEFLTQYRRQLLNEGGDIMAMRPWQELLHTVFEKPVETLHLESPAELGFVCGAVLRQFTKQYYAVTEKDYLKQRVITFGSNLTPETVWKRGLIQMFEVAPRYEKLRLSDDFRQRVGVVLTEYDHLRQETQRSKDEFMASFWSGYSLQGYDRPRQEEKAESMEESESTSEERSET